MSQRQLKGTPRTRGAARGRAPLLAAPRLGLGLVRLRGDVEDLGQAACSRVRVGEDGREGAKTSASVGALPLAKATQARKQRGPVPRSSNRFQLPQGGPLACGLVLLHLLDRLPERLLVALPAVLGKALQVAEAGGWESLNLAGGQAAGAPGKAEEEAAGPACPRHVKQAAAAGAGPATETASRSRQKLAALASSQSCSWRLLPIHWNS